METKIYVVYAGQFVTRDKSVIEKFIQFTDESFTKEIPERIVFNKFKKGINFYIGSRYSVIKSGDESYKLGTNEFLGQHDSEFRMKNIARQRAELSALDETRESERLEKYNNLLEDCIKPLRELARDLSQKERQALISYIISNILRSY